MAIVQTDIPMTSQRCIDTILKITETYPFCRSEELTTTAFGRPIHTLVIGNGPRKVLYTAAHHANEWITAPLLLKFAEELASALQSGGTIYNIDAAELANTATIYMIPMVDPDGVDLVTGAIEPGGLEYEAARRLAGQSDGRARGARDLVLPEGQLREIPGGGAGGRGGPLVPDRRQHRALLRLGRPRALRARAAAF